MEDPVTVAEVGSEPCLALPCPALPLHLNRACILHVPHRFAQDIVFLAIPMQMVKARDQGTGYEDGLLWLVQISCCWSLGLQAAASKDCNFVRALMLQ